MNRPLSPEEREAHDALLERACYDPFGKPHPTWILARNLGDELDHAAMTGCEWAEYFIKDARLIGHKNQATRWLKTQHTTTVADGEDRVVTRAALYSIQRQRDGVREWQPSLIEDMTAEDIAELIVMDRKQLESARLNLTTHLRLRDLLNAHPGAVTVGDALDEAGVTLAEYLSVV